MLTLIFAGVKFPDFRLKQRAISILVKIFYSSLTSLREIFQTPSEHIGTIRFMNNKRITPDLLLKGVQEESIKNIDSDHVLLIEDTTEFSFPNRIFDDLGSMSNGDIQGYFQHAGILVDANSNDVYGLAGAKFWTRNANDERSKNRHSTPIQEKESYRWLSLPDSVINKIFKKKPNCRVTVVADREADMFEFIRHFNESYSPQCDFVVRLKHDRKLEEPEERILKTVSQWEIKKEYHIEVKSGQKTIRQNGSKKKIRKKNRKAKVVLRSGKITLAVPDHLKKYNYQPQEVYIVQVEEINPPKGVEPITWTLLTSIEVINNEIALLVVDYYRRRWSIEELFRILKSGCKAEDADLESGHALMNWCAMRLIVAIRMLSMLKRRDDLRPAEILFSPNELKILAAVEKRYIGKKSTFKKPKRKSLAWAILMVSLLGGHKAVPSAPPPGQVVLWRGLLKLESAVWGYEVAMLE